MGAPPIPFLIPFDSAQGERNAHPLDSRSESGMTEGAVGGYSPSYLNSSAGGE